MNLQKLLVTTIIGITTLTSKAHANSAFVAYKPSTIPITQAPEKPKKNDYELILNMKAILEKKDDVLERAEIKYEQ